MTAAKPNVVAWLEKHRSQATPSEAKVSLRLFGYQRAILQAMSDPDVKVVYRKPGRDADLPAVGSFHV